MMPTEIENLLRFTANYEQMAGKALTKVAELDPKAKSRNRGTVCVDTNHPKNKSNKQHFPINSADQARNALVRANQYSKPPEWWSGSLQELINTVVKKVKNTFPSIKISNKSEKLGKG